MNVKNQEKYNQLRESYPCFEYRGFEYDIVEGDFVLKFHFYCRNHSVTPTHTFKAKEFYSFNHLSKAQLDLLVFNIGMIELVSYWKAFCSPTILIHDYKLKKYMMN